MSAEVRLHNEWCRESIKLAMVDETCFSAESQETFENMHQVLARKTVLLHSLNTFNTLNEAEAQGQKSIRDLVHYVSNRAEELLAKCKAWANQTAKGLLQAK